MKTKTFVIAGMLLAALTRSACAAQTPLTVAVFDFETRDESVRGLGEKIATLLSADLSANPDLITVERAELKTALGEQELGLSGTVGADSAAKVGHLTGAKILVTGRAFKVEQDLVIVAKIIGAETSRVYGEVVQGPPSSLTKLCEELAGKVGDDSTQKADTLIAKVISRDERIDRMIKALPEGKRPVVSIKIPERHYGPPIIDPAAQTELGYILEKAGFTVVDQKSDKKPDLEISGEAFSALGTRKGNLVSCRSRIEIKIHKRSNGELLTMDSQMSVAVDIAEQAAAKTALQNAADELAERVLPILVK